MPIFPPEKCSATYSCEAASIKPEFVGPDAFPSRLSKAKVDSAEWDARWRLGYKKRNFDNVDRMNAYIVLLENSCTGGNLHTLNSTSICLVVRAIRAVAIFGTFGIDTCR